MTNDARTRLPSEEDADASATDERAADGPAVEGTAEKPTDETTDPAPAVRKKKKVARAADTTVDESEDDEARRPRRRPSLPLVPVLAVLLVLLIGAGAFLWFTRAEPSVVTTDDYVEVLQAARSNIVDFTSFDHLTLDDDIEQIRRVAVGDLRDEAVEQLDSRRQEISEAEAIASTEVVGAGVTRADDEDATVLMVIQTTQESNVSEQAQVTKYRIEVEMERLDSGRWVLARITGA